MSCENCVQGSILPGEPQGQLIGDAYFHAAPTASDGAEGSSKKAIVLLTDIFGLPLVNSKLNADRLSKESGYDVWVPDFFAGTSLASKAPRTNYNVYRISPNWAGRNGALDAPKAWSGNDSFI